MAARHAQAFCSSDCGLPLSGICKCLLFDRVKLELGEIDWHGFHGKTLFLLVPSKAFGRCLEAEE